MTGLLSVARHVKSRCALCVAALLLLSVPLSSAQNPPPPPPNPNLPDLHFSGPPVVIPPTELVAGGVLEVQYTEANLGPIGAAAHTNRLLYSPEPFIVPESIELASSSVTGLDPEESISESYEVFTPADSLQAGRGFMIVELDSGNAIAEIDEINNVFLREIQVVAPAASTPTPSPAPSPSPTLTVANTATATSSPPPPPAATTFTPIIGVMATNTPTSRIIGPTIPIRATATPTPTSLVVVMPDVSVSSATILDELLISQPPDAAVLPVSLIVERSTTLTVAELQVSLSLIGSDGVTDASWAETISGSELTGTSNPVLLDLELTDVTPLDTDAYTLMVEADPDHLLPDLNRANNLTIVPSTNLLQTSGVLRFGSIETTLLETTAFTLSPLALTGTATYADVTATFASLQVQRDSSTLDLDVVSGNATFPDIDPYKKDDWEYRLSNGQLHTSGARADTAVYLPDTVSHRLGSYLGSTYRTTPIDLGTQSLDSSGCFTASSMSISDSISLFCEGLPLYYQGTSAVFEPKGGLTLVGPSVEYIHAPRFRTAPGERATNDGLFNSGLSPSGDVVVMPTGLQGTLDGSPDSYRPAFPYESEVTHGVAHVEIVDGVIESASSTISSIEIKLLTETGGCDPSTDDTYVFGFPGAPSVSSDGSIAHEQTLTSSYTLAFNTYAGESVSDAAWYQPGFVLRGDASRSAADEVDRYLLAARACDTEELYYYGEESFIDGDGFYAGINLMPDQLNGMNVRVTIGGTDSLDVTLNEGSKFYIRRGGYSGALDATLGSDSSLEIYPDVECGGSGYAIDLTSFGQAYLDNESEGLDTKIAGEVDLPFPALIEIPFEDMTLNACGNFTEGSIPEDEQSQVRTLAYWLADLTLSTLSFELKDGATSDDDRTLWVSSVNDVSGIGTEPPMQTNFRPCGSIADSLAAEPVDTTFDEYGTTIETLYLTAWDGTSSVNGFYSLVTSLEVPFFDPPRVHSQIRPSSHRLATGSPWDSNDNADADRDGWPDSYSPSGSSLSEQFLIYSSDRLITLETEIGGVIQLGYEVEYHPSETSFESPEALGQDLIVIDIESAVEYLDHDYTDISFGISIDGFEGLNFSSVTEDFGETLQEKFFDAVRARLDTLDDELTGDLSSILRPILEDLIDEHVENAIDSVQALIAGLPVDEAEAAIDADIATELTILLSDIDLPGNLGSSAGEMRTELHDKIVEIIEALEDISQAMQFSVEDIEGMVGDLIDVALAALDFVTDVDVDQVLQDIEQLQAELAAPIDEILEVLRQAEFILADPLTFDVIFTSTKLSDLVAEIESELEAYFKEGISVEQIRTLDSDDITDMILDAVFNSEIFQEANRTVAEYLMPIKEMAYEQATAVLDELNRITMEYLEEATDFAQGAEGAFKDVSGFNGAEMQGYAIISGDVLEKLHIDAELAMEVPDEMTFSGYLDVTRYEVENSGKTCLDSLDADAALDIRIGANDVGLSWSAADLSADIELALMLADGRLVNIGGSIVTEGSIDFETVSFSDLGFGAAIGQVENYIWAMGTGTFNTYTVEGGIFLGTSCSLEPLEILDPDVASLLTIDEMRGVFAKVGGSFPIYNYGCVLRIAAEAEVAGWYFADGPTYGGKLVAGAYGEGLCVVSVKGEITLIGGREGSNFFFNGQAWVAGGIGDCEPEDWDTLNDAYNDKWCYACGAQIDLTYTREEWEVDYDAACN